MTKLKVIKQDKSIEGFNPNKIYETCIRCGASEEIAKQVSRKVEEELYIIPIKRLKSLTLEKLKELDKESALNLIKYDVEHAHLEESTYGR